jgi:hypothetical protein
MLTASRPAQLTLAMLGVLGSLPANAQGQDGNAGWRELRPATLRVTGTTRDRRLAEASGLAPSVANPGLMWTIGDSGNPPELLGIDSLGTLLVVVPIRRVANVDWEAVAVGPCGAATCVYIADVGDNSESRSGVMIHRLPEPVAAASSSRVTLPPAGVATLRLRYPDHPHDVEAVGVTPDGGLLLVTKGRSDGIVAFRVPPDAWKAPIPAATATLLDTLPIVPNLGRGDAVTDLAIDRSGTRVAIRTYRTIYLFRRAESGALTPDRWTSCGILGVEPQGEGIAWLDDGSLLLISEKALFAAGTVTRVECAPSLDQ